MLTARLPRRALLRAGGALLAILATFGAAASNAAAGTVTMQACVSAPLSSSDWSVQNTPPSAGVYSEYDNCASGGRFQILNTTIPGYPNQSGQWSTVVPPGMTLSGLAVPAQAALINDNTQNLGGQSGFYVRYLWSGGGIALADGGGSGPLHYAAPVLAPIGGRYFIVQAACNISSCQATTGKGELGSQQLVDVRDLTLTAQVGAPTVIADGSDNAYYTAGSWIRGDGWPASFTASAPDGICGTRALIGATDVEGPQAAADPTRWQQCPTPVTQSLTLNTTQYANGALPLVLSARDAASPPDVSSPTTTLHVDNTPVGLSLAGPSDVAASPGAANATVTATADAGPSGATIFCSVDGGAPRQSTGTSAQIPVAGLGAHQVSCYAQNNAIDVSGQPARSATETFGLTIRQPTVEAITFSHIADKLRCRAVTKLVKVRGRRHVIRRHGRRIVIRGRTHRVKRRVRRCHARTARRRVYVVLKRHGRPVRRHGRILRVRRFRRVVLLPRRVYRTTRRVGHGRRTTVSGFLGLPDGTALPGRTITVLAAANDGRTRFVPVSSATTDANGVWVAKIPGGPSRRLEAVYGGDTTTEPASSTTVTLDVPARIRLAISPRILRWRGSIRIHGRLVGGYVPHDGVALRLLVRYPHSRQRTPLQALRTDAHGGFDFTWSYHAGRGVATYPFSIATTATESDYPFASASSHPLRVTFGRPTPHVRRHRHSRGHRHHRHRRQRHHRHRRRR